MAETVIALSPRQKHVEQFWKSRQGSFSVEDEQRICHAYETHVLGTTTYDEMSLVHAGVKSGKEDYTSFYRELSDILNPTHEEFEALALEGFDWVGLIHLLASSHGYSTARPAGRILANMHANK